MMARILLFVMVSLGLHLVALRAMPDLFSGVRLPFVPINLIQSTELHLEAVQRGAIEREVPGLWENSPVQQIRDDLVARTLSKATVNIEPTPPLPQARFISEESISEERRMAMLKTTDLYRTLEERIQKEGRQAVHYGVPKPIVKDAHRNPGPQLPEDSDARHMLTSLKETAEKHLRQTMPVPETVTLGITGPVATRQVIHIPPSPHVKVSVEADLRLKFWVFPDGTVGKVVPLVKGDAQVELAAISHIKKYRFNPLPHDAPQIEMWGEISVRSVLR